MLMRCLLFACLTAASLAPALAVAETRNVAAEALVDEFVPKGGEPANAPPVDGPYPHIYQGPLFGTLFALSNNEITVDESALRYYASLHNFARADAEIKRLKALHPNWTPPTNIYSTAGAGADEQPFWDLLAADRIEELKADIALKERSTPGWKPSRDLSNKISRKIAIEALVKKSDQKKPAEALAVADSDPSILHCAYMDANWRVADAFIDVGLPKRAFEIFHAIVATCPDHDERLATVRKSISRFSLDQVKSLIAMGAKSGDGATEFDAAKIDLTRARLAALNEGKSQDVLEPEALEDFFAEVKRSRQPADVGLSGWFEYNLGRFDKAEYWFGLISPPTPAKADATAINLVEGRALTLMKLGRVEEAAALAYLWRDVSRTLRETYVGATSSLLTRTPALELSETTLAAFATVIERDRNFEGAAALGWHRLNRSEGDDSAVWFKSALTWKGFDVAAAPDGKPIAPEIASALEGYARALARSGRTEAATQFADRWRGVSPALEAAFVSLMGGVIDAAANVAATPAEPLAHYADLAGTRRLPQSATALGWLQYRSAGYAAAIAWFRKAIVWAPEGRGELTANEGLALSLKMTGAWEEAEEVAWGFVRESAVMRAIYVSAVVSELAGEKANVPASRLQRFVGLVEADRSASGAQALGWYRLKAGNCDYAAPWFRKATAWSAAGREDAGSARGLALALKGVGAFAQAEDLTYGWRERDATLRTLFVDIGVEALTLEIPRVSLGAARLERLSQEILATRNARGAQALGWFRYRQAACGFGGQWLRQSSQWSEAPDAKTDEGLGLTLRATGRLGEAASLALPWAERAPLMKKLYIDTMVETLSRDNPPEPIAEARLKEYVDVIEPIKSPLGAQALGWYRLERHEYDQAEHWFKDALDWWPQQRRDLSRRLSAPVDDYQPILAKLAMLRPDYRRTPRAYPNSSSLIGKSTESYVNTDEGLAKTQEGYAQTLRALGRLAEAEAIAWEWRDRWPSLRKLFVEIAGDALRGKDEITPERLSRYTLAIEEAKSSSAAAAMALRTLRANDSAGAVEWYAKALSWTKAEPPDVALVEGYVAALTAADRLEESDRLATRWRGVSARFDLIYLQSELRRVRAQGGGGAATAAKLAEIAREMAKTRSADGALSLGWIAYETKDYSYALDWFKNALAWGGDEIALHAKEGMALSLRALDRVDELAIFGFAERGASPALRDAYYGGMIAWLSDAKHAVTPEARAHFETATIADHHAPGAMALGWAALRGANPATARRWFAAAVEWQGFDPLQAPDKAAPERAKLVEGYVQALRGAGEAARAEDVAYVWRDAAKELGAVYLQIAAEALANENGEWDAARLQRLAGFAQAQRSVDAASALGWRYYRIKANADALGWFERALSFAPAGPPPLKLAEGYALALRAAGKLAEAEDYTYGFAKDSPDLRAVYLSVVIAELGQGQPPLAPARVERFAGIVREGRSAAGAQALGWRALQGDNCQYAAPWFRRASTWSKDGADDAALARGLALSLRKAGAYAQAGDLAYVWSERAPEMRALYVDIGVEELTSAAPVSRVSEARLARFSQRVLADRHAKGAQAIGWRRYQQAGEGFGAEWFRLSLAWSDEDKRDAKTDEGYALSLRAAGRLVEAEGLAFRWVEDVPLMKKLYIDVLVEELSRDNPPQPVDEARLTEFVRLIEPIKSALGAQALGWYRLERGELPEAARWFKQALDWWPPQRRDKSKRLSAPVEDYKPILAKLAMELKDYRRTPRAYPNSSSLIGKSSEDYVNTDEGLAKTREGYVQTLRALGRVEEAETIAWAGRERWPSLRALFVDIAATELDRREGPVVNPARLQRFAQAIEADRSPNGAAAMAWRLYRQGEFDHAAEWFQKGLAWTKGDVAPRSLVEGYVLALEGAKRYAAAEAVARKWRNASPELNLVYVQSALQRMRAEGRSGDLGAEKFAEIEKAMAGAKSAEGALSLAWVTFDAKDYAHALAWFRNAADWGGDDLAPKAKEGVALALRALERFEDLAAFGFRERNASPAVREAYYGGMIAWLTSDKPLRMVKAEARADFEQAAGEDRNVNAGQALAWGALMRGDWALARRWFETAIEWSGFDPQAPEGATDAVRGKLVEGYVQALRASGELVRAEDLAYIWRDAGATLSGLYLEVFTQQLAANEDGVSGDRVKRFADMAEAKHSPQAAGALGWREYRAKSYPAAVAWFQKALGWLPAGVADAKIAEGYALSLRASGQPVEAEDFAWTHRALSLELRKAYVAAFSDQLLDPKLSPHLPALRLERFAEVVRADKISSGASALGWRRLQEGNCGYSLGWFRKAVGWSEGGQGDAKTYSGLAQGMRAVGMYNEAEDAAYTFADRDKELRELYVNIGVEELTRTWPRVPMSEVRIARFSGVVDKDHSAKGAQALGWKRYMTAGCGFGGRWFERAALWSEDGRGDAHLNEGYALSLRAIGRLYRAETLAYPWIGRAPSMKKLYIDVAVEELSRDNPPEPIPETRVAGFEAIFTANRSALGAQALGWYRFARGENEAAARWFRLALDWWPQRRPDANQKLAAPVDDYHALLAHLALRPEDYRRTPRAYPNSSLLIGHDTESYVDTDAGFAKTVEGYVRALAALGRYTEAEDLAFGWADRWPPMRGVLIEMAVAALAGDNVPDTRLVRYQKLIEDAHSATGAEAFGWKAYKAKDYEGAARWLKLALDWRPADAPLSLAVARAYADSLRQLKQFEEALKFIVAWRQKMPDLAAVALDIGVAHLAALDPASPEAGKVARSVAADVSVAHSASGAASLGWLAYNRKEFDGAEAWFRKAIQWAPAGADPEESSLEGFARALQAQERYEDYFRFAEEWSQRVETLKPLYLEAAAQAFAAAAASGQPIPTERLARAGKAFAQARSANGAQALAWQRVAQKDWGAAAAWFQASLDWSKEHDSKTVEGLVIALRNLKRDDDAEALAYREGQHDDGLRALYIETVADRLTRKTPAPPNEAGLRRFADVVMAAKSANGAQALGWYCFHVRQYAVAAAWFEQALGVEPSENAALGAAFAYRKLNDRENYSRVVSTYRDQFAKIAELGGGRGNMRERRAAYETGEAPTRAFRARLAHGAAAGPSPSGTGSQMALGWKLLHQNRPSEAADAFDAALRGATGRARQDAAYGRSLALLAAGKPADAGRQAAGVDLNARQRNDLGLQLLEQHAWDAYNADRFAEAIGWLDRRAGFSPETRDLRQMRSWCLKKLGRAEDAGKIQSELDQQLSR
jgi:hypothetical protein